MNSTTVHDKPRSPLALALSLQPALARVLLLAVAAGLCLLLLTLFGNGLRTFEEQVGGLAWKLDAEYRDEESIGIVAIDEKSLSELGPWPWPRETLARLSTALADYGVQLQLYDIVFPEENSGDQALLAALQSTPALLSQVPVLQPGGEQIRTGQMSHPLQGIACTPGMNNAQGFVANAPLFASVPKGHIAPLVDADGAVRRVPAFVCVDGQAYPALALAALLQATGGDWRANLQPGSGLFGPAQQLQLPAYPGLALPLDDAGNLRVSFRSAPEVFRAYSAVDVINGEIDRELLENTWALVGYTAFGLVDIVPTPWNGAAPGVEVQARILAALLDDRTPYTPNAAPLLLGLLALGFAALLWSLASTRARFAGYALAASALVLPLLALTLHIQLLNSANLWLGWLSPALYAFCAASLLSLHEYARVRMERARVLGNLSSYLPADVAQQIAYTLPNSSIDARRQDVTLLSADLRNFSAYGEARPPEEAAALLHYFFVRSTEVIQKHQGRVHEFKGDGVLALWSGNGVDAAMHALRAAQELQEVIEDVLPVDPPAGLEPLALGIGIEQGPVLIGSIGPAQRRAHALLGETVTIALRIQEMTAELAQPILIGECAARQLGAAGLESQGSYLLDGLRTPHTLFAPAPRERQLRRHGNPPLKVVQGGRL